jgi:hypothetical protein
MVVEYLGSQWSCWPEVDYTFEVVFDYGDHDPRNLASTESRPWHIRMECHQAGCQMAVQGEGDGKFSYNPEPLKIIIREHQCSLFLFPKINAKIMFR